MKYLRWSEGRREFGCIYHEQAVHKTRQDDIVVDIFVMPAIKDQRPIAVTIGRYRNFQPVLPKQKLGIDDPERRAGRLESVSYMFESLGVDTAMSAYLADEVDQYIADHALILRNAMNRQSGRRGPLSSD